MNLLRGCRVLKEQLNLLHNDEQPPLTTLGRTIVVRCSTGSRDLLSKVKAVWEPVASWGIWCDNKIPWPATEQVLSAMPGWFREVLLTWPSNQLENWSFDLQERDWIWWQGKLLDDELVKIDLETPSMPAGFWPIEVVVELAGGEILYRNMAISDEQALVAVSART